MTDRLSTGTYFVDAPCPRCGQIEELLIGLKSVLTTPEDEPGSIRVKLKGKARDHDCRQQRLTSIQTIHYDPDDDDA